MDVFNNREIAIAIWLVVIGLFAAAKKPVRAAFLPVWQAFCKRQILISLGLMTAYIALAVYGLRAIGLWELGQLKNTILWSVSVAAVSLMRISQISEDGDYFRNTIKDNFKIIAIFEFIVTFYTFPLWAELIIVPVATFLGGMLVYAEDKAQYATVYKILTGILTLFGSSLVAFAGYKLITDFWSFAQTETLSDFTLPIVLSLLYLPFLFTLSLYVSYENAFLRLGIAFQDAPLRRYAKRSALIGFHVHTGLLNRWLRNVRTRKPASRQDVKSSIAQVKTLAGREKNPEPVSPEQGWSPYRARQFLITEGLQTGDYHQDPLDDSLWFASSPYLEIGKGILPNNITYHVEGDEHVARLLKLIANFNDAESAAETRTRFADIARKLIHNAVAHEIPVALKTAILAESPTILNIEGKAARLVRESWPSGRGHELRFYLVSNLHE